MKSKHCIPISCLLAFLVTFTAGIGIAQVHAQVELTDAAAEIQAPATIIKVRGTWVGEWESDSGHWGYLAAQVSQKGRSLWGELDITNTDCGDFYGINLTGTVKKTGTITLNASTHCQGHNATLRFTRGKRHKKTVSGSYVLFVDGHIYDRGSFTLDKQ